jgi:hypothetical protein
MLRLSFADSPNLGLERLNMPADKARNRFRYSLRTLFVVVTVACLIGGWVAYQLNWIRQRHEFLLSGNFSVTIRNFDEESKPVPWSLRLFGESRPFGDFFQVPYPEGNPELQRIRRLFPEMGVSNSLSTHHALPVLIQPEHRGP